MQFESISAFLSMDGHGVYVWSAYAITLIMISANLIWPVIKSRRFVQQEMRRQQREAGRPVPAGAAKQFTEQKES